MNVFFYKEDKENSILQYETCTQNNIPGMGEKVIKKKKKKNLLKKKMVEDISKKKTKKDKF